MPNVLDRVQTGNQYGSTNPICTLSPIGGVKQINWAEGGTGDFYAQFWVPMPGSPGKWTLEQFEHYYPSTTSGAFATGVAGVQFRSATAGTPATIIATQLFTTDPVIFSGSPSTAVLRPIGMISGQVQGATGNVLSGSGFTVVRTGTGRYTVTFTSPFSSTPIVLAIPSGGAGTTNQAVIAATAVTTGGFQFNANSNGGGAVDTDWAFTADVPT